MRVIVFAKATKDTEAGVVPTKQAWEEMDQFNEELIKAGVLIAGEGLKPSSEGVRIRYSGKDRFVTDGPFPEIKEVIAGYSIWEVASMEVAVDWAKRCPMTEPWEVEIRPAFCYSEDEVNDIMSQSEE